MEKLDAILTAAVPTGEDTKGKVLGASFIVTNKDEFVYSGSAGRIDLDVNSPAFADDSFCWIASLSKLITTTCLLQLVEKKLITLDEDVRPKFSHMQKVQILRGFEEDGTPILEDNKEPITLRMLMSHTSGYPYEFSNPRALQWSQRPDRKGKFPDRSIEAIDTPLVYAPGEYWNYGTGLDWAGELIPLLCRQSLGEYMQEHIFTPLGIRDTGFHPSRLPQTKDRTVTELLRTGGELKSRGRVVEDWTMDGGGGGLYSTASDFAKFMQGLLAGKLVSEATLDLMFSHQLNEKQVKGIEAFAYHMGAHGLVAPEFPVDFPLNHGFGGMINVGDVPGRRRGGSMAWSGASGPRWWIDRKTGIAAVLMLNVMEYDPAVDDSGATPTGGLWQKLEDATYGELLK